MSRKIILFLNQDYINCRKQILQHPKNNRNFLGEIENKKIDFIHSDAAGNYNQKTPNFLRIRFNP